MIALPKDLLTTDSMEFQQCANNIKRHPIRVEPPFNFDAKRPIGIITMAELLPLYTSSFIQSTRVDGLVVAVYSDRLRTQKILARIIDIVEEEKRQPFPGHIDS